MKTKPSKYRLLAFCTAFLCPAPRAMTPPPPMTDEERICKAQYVFVGATSHVRFVTSTLPACVGKPATQGEGKFLSSCGSAEVDTDVLEVLYPVGWKPAKPVIYRFGGGWFNTESLKGDLEGQTRLLYVVPDPQGGDNVFVTSAPWDIGGRPDAKEWAQKILAGCERPAP